eukprot:scaffold16300_cov150-Cylindrotheca_fusiformis.AAC.8
MQHSEVEDAVWNYTGQEVIPATVRRIKIAENVTEIPDNAFRGHPELEEITLSSSVQVIGKWAFYDCRKLKCILCQGLEKEEVGIPSTVKVIDEFAFAACKLLARLVLNEGLERIERYAFRRCESLTEVDIPSTVKVIGNGVFDECRHLERLRLNEGLEQIGEFAFCDCESLTEVHLPSTVKVIGNGAFQSCKLLTRIVLNEGLERIGRRSFFECESLAEAKVPSTVKVIDDLAFFKCFLLLRLFLNEGLEQIGEEAYVDCFSLSHIRIPQSVNRIASDAFSYCSNLISIELPEVSPFHLDLSGCRSLLNVAGPISAIVRDGEREEFFQSSRLGIFVDDEADLRHRLNHRFDNSALNKLCYYQSYYQSLDDAMVQLRSSLMEADLPFSATTQVDAFGLTPLHVLSLSQTPNLDMILAVVDAGKPGHMVHSSDSFGCTPMEYLSLNPMPNSIDVIRRLFQTRFEQVLGLDQLWKSDMLQAIDEALAGDWVSRKSEIGRVVRKYERKEILSLVELCLWKMKIDEATSKKAKIGEATSKQEQILANRQKCRIMSGAAVVIPHVLLFLDN